MTDPAKKPKIERIALMISDDERAQSAADALERDPEWAPLEEADAVVVLGGDGYMLQMLHAMMDSGRIIPAYGVNHGTVGFLMNRSRDEGASPCQTYLERLRAAKAFHIAPLHMQAVTRDDREHDLRALNEVSLLRETRQTAKIEITVNGRVRLDELVCDGVLVATPAGSTAYNLSANGPILPLDSRLLALTPISPFRPRRWPGAILPDRSSVRFRILEPDKRPVSVVADQKEIRDVARVRLSIARDQQLTLLFDQGHALDERIAGEQFMV